MGVHRLGVGRHEAAHTDAVDLTGWIGGGDTYKDSPPALARYLVPEGQFSDRTRVDYVETTIGMVTPIAEAVHAERAGILAGRQTHPGRDSDGRNHALQLAIT